jgi:hypothetical protein
MFTPFAFVKSAVVYDPDAQAFFNAVMGGGDTLTQTEMDGTNELVINLKADGIWTQLDAFYPLVGGTASSQKWNLMNPQNTDAAFRLTFISSSNFTFTSKGFQSNASSNTGVDTHYNPSVDSIANDRSMGCYIFDKGTLFAGQGQYDMGCYDGTRENALIAGFLTGANSTYLNWGGGFNTKALAGDEAESFWYGESQAGTNGKVLYRNGVSWQAFTQTDTRTNFNLGLACSLRAEGYTENSNRGYSMFFMGEALGSTLQADFNTNVQTWLTALGKLA